jgi:hypothetical protein
MSKITQSHFFLSEAEADAMSRPSLLSTIGSVQGVCRDMGGVRAWKAHCVENTHSRLHSLTLRFSVVRTT